jgi:hypothetical protein
MARHDWAHWYAVFREVQRAGNLTLVDFCRAEKLPYGAAQKAFRRLEMAKEEHSHNRGESGRTARTSAPAKWESLRLEFLQGDWITLSDFAKDRGLNSSTGYFSKMTKGWLDQKAEIRAKTAAESVAAIADQKGAEAIARLHARVLTALYTCLSDLEANGPVREQLHGAIDGVKDNADFLRGVSVAIDSLLKLLPAVSRIEGSVAARDIIQQLAAGEVDVTRAALAFEEMGVALPDSVKILLGKQEPIEPELPENETPSDDELERRWREGISRIRKQEEDFLPQRQREVEELKRECKDADSFSGIEDGGD